MEPPTSSPMDHPGASHGGEDSTVGAPTPPLALGLTAALLTCGWALRDGLYEAPQFQLGFGAAVLGLLLLGRALAKGQGVSFRCLTAVVAIGIVCALAMASADRALVRWEVRTRPWEGIARAVTPLLDLAGHRAVAEGGALHLDHPDGLLTVLPSPEKLGLRPLLELWLVWIMLHLVVDGRRTFDVAVVGLLALIPIAVVRFVACLFVYLEHDNILVGGNGFDALSVFSGVTATTITLIVSGLVLDRIRRRLVRAVPSRPMATPAVRSVAWRFVGAVGLSAVIGFSATCEPAGPRKSGRVLIDDQYGGIWEPTARQLDTQWYGDFATYSFNSLAEWLGHWFVVDVNPQRPYTDELLAGYDILVLKTPVQPIPEAQREAIDRFVNAGGGLLLIGDHTNLLGMGTHLNSLCSPYGIKFNYDSVSDARSGAFVDYYGPSVGRSVAALHVDHFQFMTGCSLRVDWRAEAIMVVPSCRRDPHDYAASSFFGRSGPHPELAHGPVVVAASVPAGQGKIVAFTDSTIWSSFATFQFDREKLAADMIGVLNRGPSPLRLPLRVISITGLIVAIFLGVGAARSGAVLAVLLGGLIGFWAGVFGADTVHRAAYDLGPPRAPIHEVSFLWAGGNCAFPPVLGSTGNLPLDQAYDTLFTSVQRVGLVPRVAWTYDRDLLTPHTRVLFVVAPVDRPPPSTLRRIESFVRGGGALVVLDDGRLGGRGSAPDYMNAFGIEVRYTRETGVKGEPTIHSTLSGLTELKGVPAPETFVGHRAFGAGHVIYMRDAIDYSRVGMGHCFNRPGKLPRGRYNTIFWLLRDILKAAPTDRRFYGICDQEPSRGGAD